MITTSAASSRANARDLSFAHARTSSMMCDQLRGPSRSLRLGMTESCRKSCAEAACQLQLQQKFCDVERCGRAADFGDVGRPFVQQFATISKGAGEARDHLIIV